MSREIIKDSRDKFCFKDYSDIRAGHSLILAGFLHHLYVLDNAKDVLVVADGFSRMKVHERSVYCQINSLVESHNKTQHKITLDSGINIEFGYVKNERDFCEKYHGREFQAILIMNDIDQELKDALKTTLRPYSGCSNHDLIEERFGDLYKAIESMRSQILELTQ
ncbi:hypothetical protein HNO53_12995 [Billgrantia antri]|uniref:HEPN domain-containing protein n=1 Tax=Halomonas sulfidivorans TaxID=2733488 RepID=A0ABX7WIZ5_9GAMM|nr:hypothetical protein [Halomonas sulfidivorans]QTP59552.1 hypothetical protein HNO53_12995 [Halomonas sulfidivorans]